MNNAIIGDQSMDRLGAFRLSNAKNKLTTMEPTCFASVVQLNANHPFFEN